MNHGIAFIFCDILNTDDIDNVYNELCNLKYTEDIDRIAKLLFML